MERARGLDDHNLVSVVQYENGLDLAGVFEWVENVGKACVSGFLSDLARVPMWGDDKDLAARVKTYIDGLGYWIRGIDVWSFESMRYFGCEGLSIQKHRMIKLRSDENGYVKASHDQDV
jgi:hypothetical protein